MSVFASQEWSPSHNLKSLRKKQLATREAMARQTVVSDAELSIAESSVIRCRAPFPAAGMWHLRHGWELDKCQPKGIPRSGCRLLLNIRRLVFQCIPRVLKSEFDCRIA